MFGGHVGFIYLDPLVIWGVKLWNFTFLEVVFVLFDLFFFIRDTDFLVRAVCDRLFWLTTPQRYSVGMVVWGPSVVLYLSVCLLFYVCPSV